MSTDSSNVNAQRIPPAFTGRQGIICFAVPVAMLLVTALFIAPLDALGDAVAGRPHDSIGDLPPAAMMFAISLVFATWVSMGRFQFPADRLQVAAWPPAIAAGSAAAIAVLAAAPENWQQIPLIGLTSIVGLGASFGAQKAARRALGHQALPTSTRPAPADVIRLDVDAHSTAVWTSRAARRQDFPHQLWVGWALLAIVMGGLIVWAVLGDGDPTVMVSLAAWLLITQIGVGFFHLNNFRIRLTIGRTGLRIRTGLTRRVLLEIDLDQIDSAWITDAPAANFWTSWGKESGAKRLSFLTREGPAILIRLTDGTDVVAAVDDPITPVGVLNTLLDRRAIAC